MTGELERASETLELYRQAYPRLFVEDDLATPYQKIKLGSETKSREGAMYTAPSEIELSVRLDSKRVIHSNTKLLFATEVALGSLDDA